MSCPKITYQKAGKPRLTCFCLQVSPFYSLLPFPPSSTVHVYLQICSACCISYFQRYQHFRHIGFCMSKTIHSPSVKCRILLILSVGMLTFAFLSLLPLHFLAPTEFKLSTITGPYLSPSLPNYYLHMTQPYFRKSKQQMTQLLFSPIYLGFQERATELWGNLSLRDLLREAGHSQQKRQLEESVHFIYASSHNSEYGFLLFKILNSYHLSNKMQTFCLTYKAFKKITNLLF